MEITKMSLSEKLKSMVAEGKFTSGDAKINTALESAKGVAEGVLKWEGRFLALGYRGRKSLRAMIYQIGVTFKPAANAISELLTEKSRGGEKPAIPMKRVDVSPDGEPPQDGGCKDCNESKTATRPAAKLSEAKSKTDVIAFFDSDIDKMRAFTAAQNIDLGKASTMDGVAQKILDWIRQ